MRCLLRFWAHFLIGWFVFLLLSFKGFGIFWMTFVYQIYFRNVDSHSITLLIILLTLSLTEVLTDQLVYSLKCAFALVYKKSLPYLRSSRFSLMLSSGRFINLHLDLLYILS